MPDSELLLWQRQVKILEELRPDRILWSGPPREGMLGHLHVVLDTVKNAGPLAGISAALDILESDLLVVLAIDLPRMNATFLQNLLTQCTAECGAVTRHGDLFEPLAAIYPGRIAPLARRHLEEGRYALQELVREVVRQGMMEVISLDDRGLALFKNLNTPDDLEDISAHKRGP